MKIPMISKVSHTYGGKRLAIGDPFLVKGQSDARLLRALGRAGFAPEEAPAPDHPEPVVVAEKPKRVYTRKVVETEPAADQVAETPAYEPATETKPKRAYIRRDLTAEE